MLLSTCDFHENWPSEGHTFRVGVKKLIYACNAKQHNILEEKNFLVKCVYYVKEFIIRSFICYTYIPWMS